MLLADTCAEGSLTAAKGDINSRSILGDRTKVQKRATSPCCTAHSTRHPDWTHNSEHSSRPVGGEVRAERQPRRRPREPICRGRGAWRGQACTAGAGPRGREGRHAEGMREAEEAARASRTGRRGAWHLQRVHDRLGARSSAMTKATTQPAVRAEGWSPRRARSPPAWRIETRASELRRRSRARVDGPGR